VTEQASTAVSGACDLAAELPAPRPELAGLARTASAIVRLARARDRLRHVPTIEQIRAMAWFDGREPCSYLLDPARNYVPELPVGGEDPLGRYGLSFTGRHANGCLFELVALPDGWAFDLLGPFA